MDVEGIKTYLKNYAGPRIRIMEVCGSHTAAIEKTVSADFCRIKFP